MSNLPPGLEPLPNEVAATLPPGLEADIGAAGRRSKLDKEIAADEQAAAASGGAMQRFLRGMTIPTTKEEFLNFLKEGALNAGTGMQYSMLYKPAKALYEDHSYEGFNRALNPTAPAMEDFGSGNTAGGLGGLAANLIAGSIGGKSASRSARISPNIETLSVPVTKKPGLGARTGKAAYELVVPKPIKAAKALLGVEDTPAVPSTKISDKRAIRYKESADPLRQHTFDPDNLIRKPITEGMDAPPSNFEGSWLQPPEAAYGNAPALPGLARSISVDDFAPQYVKGALHESVPGAMDISPAPVSLDFSYGNAPSTVQGTGGRFQRSPISEQGFVNPQTGIAGPFELGNAGSTVTQGMTPPLGPADLQGIKGQTGQMLQSVDVLGENAVAGVSPAQMQQLLELLSQLPDKE